jgi:hypothetical protein
MRARCDVLCHALPSSQAVRRFRCFVPVSFSAVCLRRRRRLYRYFYPTTANESHSDCDIYFSFQRHGWIVGHDGYDKRLRIRSGFDSAVEPECLRDYVCEFDAITGGNYGG